MEKWRRATRHTPLRGAPRQATDNECVIQGIKQRVAQADLPDPVFAVLGAVDLAAGAPRSLGSYYGQLVERGHARLVAVGTERAVRKRVSRFESSVTPAAQRMAVRYKQRQRRRATA